MQKDLPAYKNLIDRFSKTRILVVGDLMVDRFIRGKVSRISPEAPVPVVLVKDQTDLPGGAGNVTMNLAALGARVRSLGVLGEDAAGEKLLSRFREAGIETQSIRKEPGLTTILKTRVIAEHQQVVRFDQENAEHLPPAIEAQMIKDLPEMVRSVDGVILSDYGKGMITKSILTRVITLANQAGKPVCVDPKLEHFLLYKNVTCITPNLGEAMGGMHRVKLGSKNGVLDLGKDILKTLRCKSVLITQGEEGMSLFEKNRVTHIPANAREVFDVTGAGDTVIGVLTLALACGADLVRAATLANLAAGIVIGKLGTATVTPTELKDALPFL